MLWMKPKLQCDKETLPSYISVPAFALQMPITEATSQAITSVSLERGLWELGAEGLFIIQNNLAI